MKRTLLLLCLCAGCSTPKVWYQPNKTPAQAYQDLADCRAQAEVVDNHYEALSGIGGRIHNNSRVDRFISDSMHGRGYDLLPISSVPNGKQYPPF